MSYPNNYFLQSAPFKIYWAGFESDTLTLQNNGWNVAVEDRFDYLFGMHEVRFILRHEMLDLYCVTYMNTFEFQDLTNLAFKDSKHLQFRIQVIGKNIHYQTLPEFCFSSIQEIDCRPSFTEVNYGSISDLSIFKTLIKPDSALIVEPEKISELLKKIVEAQAPNQAEIRERIRRGEARDNVKQTLHAQILSVAA